jgi:hypothetical protein
MITDEKVEAALDYLRINASKAAKAKAERVYMEEFRKVVKANIMKKFNNLPLQAQEREAYDSAEYRQQLQAMKEAIEADEFCRWGLVAAQATLDAWRTENANRRADKV